MKGWSDGCKRSVAALWSEKYRNRGPGKEVNIRISGETDISSGEKLWADGKKNEYDIWHCTRSEPKTRLTITPRSSLGVTTHVQNRIGWENSKVGKIFNWKMKLKTMAIVNCELSTRKSLTKSQSQNYFHDNWVDKVCR